MGAAESKAVDLSVEEHDRVQRLLADFERSWEPGRLAHFIEQLPPSGHPLRTTTLLGLVRIDLERQWQRGAAERLDTYLERYPELGPRESIPVSLIVHEYRLRQRCGAAVDVEDYARRFPHQARELRGLLGSGREAAPFTPSPVPSRAASDSLHDDAPATDHELPAEFDRYRILKKLGQGGMGAVYLAHDTKLDRRVALKVPTFSPDAGTDNLQRFYREARATATIQHPNLCPLYDVGEYNGIPYLTMAYIEGWPLAHFIRPEKRLPAAGAAALVRTIALALAEAHKLGIIHRDLKPGNVIINKRGQPIVMDFGLARWLTGEHDEVGLHTNGTIVGAPVYMSPEQVYGDVQNMGPACDIYSLGVILYELLTGRLPFEGPTTAVLAKTLLQPPAPPSTLRPGLDPQLDAICLKAMAKQPAERFGSMEEMAGALNDYLKTEKKQREATPSAASGVTGSGSSASGRRSSQSGEFSFLPGDSDSKSGVASQTDDDALSATEHVVRAHAPNTNRLPGAEDPSVSLIQRIAPMAHPQLESIQQPRKKRWLAGMGVVLLLLAGGALLAWKFWPVPTVGVVQLNITPPEAKVQVEVDDTVFDPKLIAGGLQLPAGNHRLTITCTSKEFEPFDHSFSLQVGDVRTIDVELKPTAKAAAPQPAPAKKVPDGPPAIRVFKQKVPPIMGLAIAPNGRRALLAGHGMKNPTVRLWEITVGTATVEGQELAQLKGHKQPVVFVAFAPDNQRACTASQDGTVRVWAIDAGTELLKIDTQSGGVSSAVFSPDGTRILSGGGNGQPYLWNAATGKKLRTFKQHKSRVNMVAFTPNGKQIVTVSADPAFPIGVSDAATGELLWHPDGPRGSLAVAVSPDSKYALTGGADNKVWLWDLETRESVHVFEGHTNAVSSLAFSPDSRLALSCGADLTIRLWDVVNRKPVAIYNDHTDVITGVAFHPDGKHFASVSKDKSFRWWKVP